MTPSASLLLLLLLGLSWGFPVEEEGSPEEEEEEWEEEGEEEEDTVDMTTRILSTNNGSTENLVEGDLLIPTTRNAIRCQRCFWKKANGVVTIPYVVSRQFSSFEIRKITNAMNAFTRSTCIRFKQRAREYSYISIENQRGCFSALGMNGGKQVLSLNRQGCLYHGIIIHELIHALGFQHEQTRSDRDSYVRINWQNMNPQMGNNFQKQNTNNLNTPYDYSSIMHYGRTAFSINGRDTITPIPNANVQIGQRRGMSRWDVKRINLLYRC